MINSNMTNDIKMAHHIIFTNPTSLIGPSLLISKLMVKHFLVACNNSMSLPIMIEYYDCQHIRLKLQNFDALIFTTINHGFFLPRISVQRIPQIMFFAPFLT